MGFKGGAGLRGCLEELVEVVRLLDKFERDANEEQLLKLSNEKARRTGHDRNGCSESA